jgi:hypothetical protein
MGVVVGAALFVVYAALMLQGAVLRVAMNGARKKPPTRWSVPGAWLLFMAVPLWGR